MAIELQMTDRGAEMMTLASSGQTLTITNFAVGKGEFDMIPPTSEIKERTSLKLPVEGLTNISITSGSVVSNMVHIEGSFSSQDAFSYFAWSELGIYACLDGDLTNKELFAYGCVTTHDSEDVVHFDQSAVAVEYNLYEEFTIDAGANVTVLVETSSDWVSEEDLTAHITDHNNPHQVTAAQVGLTGSSGTSAVNSMKVTFTPSTADPTQISNNSTLTTLFARISRLVNFAANTLKDHIANKNNPHHVTYTQLSGAVPINKGGTGSNGVDYPPNTLFEEFWFKLLNNGSIGSGNPNVLFGVYYGNGVAKRKVSINMVGVGFVLVFPEWGWSTRGNWTYNNVGGGGMALAGESGSPKTYQCLGGNPIPYYNVDFATWNQNQSFILPDYANGCFYVNAGSSSLHSFNTSGVKYYFIAMKTDGTAGAVTT